MINVFEIVGRVTKNIYLTKANDGQTVARCRIDVGNKYWIVYIYGPIGQAMAHQIRRGMYVKLTATYHNYINDKPDFANKTKDTNGWKATDVWLANYNVIHFEKLDKQAYDNYKPCGQKVRLVMDGDNGKLDIPVNHYVLPYVINKVLFIPAYTYLIDHVN